MGKLDGCHHTEIYAALEDEWINRVLSISLAHDDCFATQ
jgi:hypothetical protein